MSRPRVSLISVTYRSAEAAELLLRSAHVDGWMRGDGGPTARGEVSVVDSGSGDGTAEVLAEKFARLHIIASAENIGFGRGCNLGARAAEGEYLLFVNPDVQLSLGVVSSLVDYLDARPAVAIVGPALVDEARTPSIAAQRFPSLGLEMKRQWAGALAPLGWRDRGDRAPLSRGPVDWVSGACLLVRRRVFESLGGFDEGFFLYFEETDLCRRAVLAGHEVHHVPDLSVVHAQGACAKKSDQTSEGGRLVGPFRASRKRYFQKHHGPAVAAAVECVHWARALRHCFKRGRAP